MLDARVMAAEGARDAAPVLVLMHGRGADASDLAPLRDRVPASVSLVLPRAPHPGAQWGYGPGWAWYRYEGEDRPADTSFRESQEALAGFLDGLADTLGHRPGPVAIGGFSQGGTMGLGYALQHPGSVPAVLVFSGFVPDHADVHVTAESVAGTAFWWGHGTQDPAIPHTMATRGRARLREAGAELTTKDYPMGHGISPRELDDAMRWLEDRLGATGA